MEHIVYSNVMSHMESNNILSDMQFGFRKRRSAELQLLQTVHDLSYNLNAKSQTDLILLDLSKAFDKVPHCLLLLNLSHHGMRGDILICDRILENLPCWHKTNFRTKQLKISDIFSIPIFIEYFDKATIKLSSCKV